jgi:hypothetical protein
VCDRLKIPKQVEYSIFWFTLAGSRKAKFGLSFVICAWRFNKYGGMEQTMEYGHLRCVIERWLCPLRCMSVKIDDGNAEL